MDLEKPPGHGKLRSGLVLCVLAFVASIIGLSTGRMDFSSVYPTYISDSQHWPLLLARITLLVLFTGIIQLVRFWRARFQGDSLSTAIHQRRLRKDAREKTS
jgi:hypothetical protein